MDQDLKNRLIENTFMEHLRLQLSIDIQSYGNLCTDLKMLAVNWKSEKLIDKEVVQYIYLLPAMTRAMADVMFEDQDQIEEMAIEFEALIEDCFDCRSGHDIAMDIH